MPTPIGKDEGYKNRLAHGCLPKGVEAHTLVDDGGKAKQVEVDAKQGQSLQKRDEELPDWA
jgi:hypothetical protein